jgi:hypothetical protein
MGAGGTRARMCGCRMPADNKRHTRIEQHRAGQRKFSSQQPNSRLLGTRGENTEDMRHEDDEDRGQRPEHSERIRRRREREHSHSALLLATRYSLFVQPIHIIRAAPCSLSLSLHAARCAADLCGAHLLAAGLDVP